MVRPVKFNEIQLRDDCAELIIDSPKFGILICKIDKEDVSKIQGRRWCARYAPRNNSLYVCSSKNEFLHRVVTNCKNGYEVDHINHDTLDNRKVNLRCVTRQINSRNLKKQCGVWFDKQRKGWHARIGVDYKSIELGIFATYEEALKARQKAEAEYFN